MSDNYSGILDSPITIVVAERSTILSGGEKEDKKIQAKYDAEKDAATEARIVALFNHFGIDSECGDAWKLLAIKLAMKHVPGFDVTFADGRQNPAFEGEFISAIHRLSPPPQRGAPVKWDLHKRMQLAADVLRLIDENGLSGNSACANLAKPKYASRYNGETSENLKRKFEEIKKQIPVGLRKGFLKNNSDARKSLRSFLSIFDQGSAVQ